MNAKHFYFPALLLFFLCFSMVSTAQISVKAGVNYASIAEGGIEQEGYDELENKSVLGFQAGLAFDLMPDAVFSIQPEILYIQKGGRVTYGLDEDNQIESRVYYNYIDVPILAKLKFLDEESGSGFYFIGGPYAGYALGGRSKNTLTLLGTSTDSEDDFTFDDEDDQRRLDWGIAVGGGLKFGNAYLDLRYNLGINNLLDADADNTNDNKPYRRHRGIGLTLGYGF